MALPIDYEIRRLGPDDVELMRGMIACFGEAFEDAATYLGDPPEDGYLSDLLSDDAFVALAAIRSERVVGGLVAYELRKFERQRSEFYIYDLAVLEAHRRRGVATSLIEALKPVARSRSGWVIFVQADLVDEAALALYEKLGVRENGVAHFDIPVE